jgi:hypothetical protein
MREARKTQSSLRETWLDLDHAKELESMSRSLGAHLTIAELIWQDLPGTGAQSTRGAEGLSAEQVLRILVVKQLNGFSYRALAFHLADSRSYQTFCRLGLRPARQATDEIGTPSESQAGHVGGDQSGAHRCRATGESGDGPDRAHRLHRCRVQHP